MIFTIVGFNFPIIVFSEESYAHTQEMVVRKVHTRSLAASCAACHGTQGNGVGNVAKLAGINSSYFVTQMQAFKSGERIATVMHHHAKGLNSQEILDLADYFSAQAPKISVAPSPQKLEANHAN